MAGKDSSPLDALASIGSTSPVSRLAPGSQNWHSFPISAGVPAFLTAARGAAVFDADDREVIDLYCGSGAVILGHADPAQISAVRSALANGPTVSLRHPVEAKLADLLVSLCPGARYAAFFKTGSEAVHAAITTAIKATGRRGIVTTTYHGWLLPLGELRDTSGYTVAPVNWSSPTLTADVAALAATAACIVVSPTTETPGLDAVREVADAARAGGAIVIFDEVKSGFRYAYPTVGAAAAVEPDITVVSKAIGNGFPIAAVLGGDLLATEETFSVYSTYASELVSETAAVACLESLAAGAYESFAESSRTLYEELGVIGAKIGAEIAGVPTFFRLSLPSHLNGDDLCRRLYEHGVLYHPLDQVLVTSAHDGSIIERVCAAFDAALGEIS
jgi:glutamate-1-semialdehyde 2,1-aminomutase